MVEINIEVVYALPYRQFLFHVKVAEGASVEDGIMKSGILSLRDDIDLSKNKVGIYSRLVKLSDILSNADRVEIYRPLLADPKEIRRKRAEKANKLNSPSVMRWV